MKLRAGFGIPLFVSVVFAVGTAPASGQEPRLVGRVPDAARAQIDALLAGASAGGLPVEPLVDRALEGAVKGAPPDRIVSAVARLRQELTVAREAFGENASAAELTAGASALRAGATRDDLAQLRQLRTGQPLTVAAAVLADLVAAGVPVETGIGAVLALAKDAEDTDYVAFRRNVERDIALGASPVAAIGVRLRALAEVPTAADGLNSVGGGLNSETRSGPRKRKP